MLIGPIAFHVAGEYDYIPSPYAEEIGRVGAIIGDPDTPIGQKLMLVDQPAVIVAEITREEFKKMCAAAGLALHRFASMPSHLKYFAVSTD